MDVELFGMDIEDEEECSIWTAEFVTKLMTFENATFREEEPGRATISFSSFSSAHSRLLDEIVLFERTLGLIPVKVSFVWSPAFICGAEVSKHEAYRVIAEAHAIASAYETLSSPTEAIKRIPAVRSIARSAVYPPAQLRSATVAAQALVDRIENPGFVAHPALGRIASLEPDQYICTMRMQFTEIDVKIRLYRRSQKPAHKK